MEFVNHLTDKLWFAVPKKGRLNQAVLDLLSGADIQFRRDHRLDIALVKNLPIALIFLPAADIPIFVGEGKCSLGITGWDQIAEYESGEDTQENIVELLDLRFGKCLLQVQVPENGPLQEPEQLIGKTICTSFPNLTETYFRQLEYEADTLNGVENGVSSFEKLSLTNGMSNGSTNGETKAMSQPKLRTRIKELSGSVEAACALGVADAIVDLVESGETMRAAGLKPISTVLSSRAVLITSKKPSYPQLVELIAARIRGVINAKRYVLCTYNIERKNLEHACKVTPGRRAPTIMPLEDEGWVAVSAMVEREDQALTMDELIKLGADDIMINTISNTRTQ